MLEFLRKHTVIVMAAVALVFVGLVFLNDGKSMPGGSAPPIFKVAGTSYTAKDFNDKYARYFEIARRSGLIEVYQDIANLASIATNEPETTVMLYSILLRHEADRYGIYPGDDEIEQIIKVLPLFTNEDGSFNQEAYELAMSLGGKSNRQLNEASLREVVGDYIRFQVLRSVIANGVEINESFSKSLFESKAQNMEVNTAFLSESDYRPTTDPTEEQIKEYWEKHKQNYLSEETRDITVYLFKPKAPIEASDKSKIPTATLDVMDEVDTLWEKIAETNAKEIDDMVNTMAKEKESLLTLEKKEYKAVKNSNEIQELQAVLNPAAGSTEPTLIAKAYALVPNAGKMASMYDDKNQLVEPEPKLTGMTADQVSTALVLEDGNVALLTVSNIMPIAPLKYEQARAAARSSLLDEMTEQNLLKAAQELQAKLTKEATTPEQFKSIAETAKAKVEHWPSFNIMTIPPQMIAGRDVFLALRKVNDGGISEAIPSATEGAVIAQLVKRTIEDSPQMGQAETMSVLEGTADMRSMLLRDWFTDCIKKYNVQILAEPRKNAEN